MAEAHVGCGCPTRESAHLSRGAVAAVLGLALFHTEQSLTEEQDLAWKR